MAANDKVMFKLGSQSSIDAILEQKGAAGSYQVGAFYLTNDSDRLYVGQADGLKLLNRSVRVVTTVSEMEQITPKHKDDFVYISDKNILAVYNGTSWTQINPDTLSYVTDLTDVIGSEVNGASITTTLTQTTAKDAKKTITGTKVKIAGVNGAKVEGDTDTNTINITGDTYTLSSSIDTDTSDAKIKTANIKLTSALGQAASNVKVKAASQNVSIAAIDGGFSIDTADTKLKDVALVGSADGSGKVTVTVSDTAKTEKSSTVKLGYQVGGVTKKFVGIGTDDGLVNLDVYTTKEVDDKFKILNPMRYIGTVGTSGIYTLDSGNNYRVINRTSPSTLIDISSGDMFLVAGEITYATGKKASTGDLLIASGTENNNGILEPENIVWNWVPSGDDSKTDTTYTFEGDATQNSWRALQSGTAEVGKIQLKAGTSVNISSEVADDNKTLISTVGHADVPREEPAKVTKTLSSTEKTFDAIKSIEVNAQGHVTKLETETVTTNVYTSGPDVVDVVTANSSVKVKHSLIENDNIANPIQNKDSYTIFKSESLQVTSVDEGTGVGLELVWGSF